MWENDVTQGSKPIIRKELEWVEHYGILKNADTVNYILKLLTGVANFVEPPKTNITLNLILNESHVKAVEILKNLQFRFL